MKAKQLHEMTTEELTSKVAELKGELFNLRFQLATGQLQNPMSIKQTKRDIAKAQTILREREIKAAAGGQAEGGLKSGRKRPSQDKNRYRRIR